MKLAVVLVIFAAAAFASVCPPTVNYACSDVGGLCTTTQPCTNCTNTFASCLSSDTECNCFIALVTCLNNAKNPNCDPSTYYSSCMSTVSNCSCGTPNSGALTDYNCRSNSYCETSTGTCVALKTAGQSCTDDSQCGVSGIYSYPFECSNTGTCEQQSTGYAFPNDACTASAQCYYNSEGLGCVNGLCAAHPVGSSCTNPGSCDNSGFCNTTINTCQAIYKPGATCKVTLQNGLEEVCGLNYICGGRNVCVAYYSQSAGSACSTTDECSGSNVCLAGVCASPLPQLACSNDTQCTNANAGYSSCVCGYCVMETRSFVSCQPLDLAFVNCVTQNNCSSQYSLIPNSCIERNCNAEYLCDNACYFADATYADTACFDGSYTCPSPSSASTIAASVAFIVASVIALLF